MKIKHIITYSVACILMSGTAIGQEQPLYLNPDAPVRERVEDLMSRMTLRDKINQMNQFVGLEHMRAAEKEITEEELINGHARGFYKGLHSDAVARMVAKGEIGSFLHVTSLEEANYLQSLAEKSPLKIPLLIGIDAIHGNGLYRGATIYPSPISAASAFCPELWEQASRETAEEMRATGSHWAFSPNIEIARDARWGRVGETFGEDPYLVSRMGVASVKGLQGNNEWGSSTALACIKHLLGGGAANNGTNAAPVEMGEGMMRNVFLPPFKSAIEEARPFTLMPAHNEINGIPCHCNRILMEDIIRKEYGFDGFIVSDWMDIEAIFRKHKAAVSTDDAYRLSVNAGVDMHMHGPRFADSVERMVNDGLIPESRINEACAKILEAKFMLGLFENRYADPEKAKETVFSEEHRQTALEIARRSVVLLENDGILPLEKGRYKKILVSGPNADNQSVMGDWVFEQPRENVTTILDGIISEAGDDTDVKYVDVGWNLREISEDDIRNVEKAARKSDLAILVLGEDSFREHWKEKTCGENRCRMDITLWGLQEEMARRVAATGVPTIVILVNGRPLATPWISENIPAVIEAWEPGSTGGTAVAEILFGKTNPSGKLPITVPRHVGQITTVYNHKPSQFSHPVIDGDKTPLYTFGYGLSYTTFKYSDISVDKRKISASDKVNVSVTVTNTGKTDGEEVIQLYISDDYSSTTRAVKELKRFKRVFIPAGESVKAEFTIDADDLSYYDYRGEYIIEPGSFTIMIGGSSMDKDLIKEKITLE